MRARAYTALISLMLLLAAPSAATGANRTIAPPGNSAVNQYVENVPTASGGRPTSTIHASSKGQSSAIPPRTERSLAAHGRTGRAAAQLAAATAPHRAKRSGNGSRGSSPATSVVKALAGSGGSVGGLGALLPVILIASAIVGGAISIMRRRGGP